MKFVLGSLLALMPLASAHFLLKYPATVGFDDDKEGMGPCGGFTNYTGNGTTIQVGGFPIQLQSTHPAADWQFRAMQGTNGTSWTTLMPIIHQAGLGDFCIPDFKVPESWAGTSGLLQVIQNAVDGFLYQCAVVTYNSGVNSSTSGCTNASAITATAETVSSFTSMPTAAATVGSGSGSGSDGSSTSAAMAAQMNGGLLAVGMAGMIGVAALL